MSKKTNSPRMAQRTSPHITAENFKTELRPTLLNYKGEFLAYELEGAYRLIDDGLLDAEMQDYLETAEEMRPIAGGKMKAFPFNPTTRTVNEVVEAMFRKYQVRDTSQAPPFFIPGENDWSFLDPLDVIACRNGLLQISERKLWMSSAQYFTRTALPIEYDADAEPVRWLSFLDEVMEGDADLILLIQQMFGYLLTSDTSQQKIFFMRGVSGSGKGTIMRVLDALIGERNICNPTIAALADKNTLNDMTGATLAKITDANMDHAGNTSAATSIMMAISGEDPVHVFRKFLGGINVRMRVRFLMAGNQYPKFGEHATAMGRRLIVIPFNRSFADAPDATLGAKLIAELPGILNWALDGLASLREAGKFIEPAASLTAKDEIMNSGDPVRSFVAAECELGPDFEVNKETLFGRYQLHCGKIGAKQPLTYPSFLRNLKTHFNGVRPVRPRTEDGGREQAMGGIRLRDDQRERVPFISIRLDPDMLDLGFARWEPEAILRDASGKPVEYVSTDFDE